MKKLSVALIFLILFFSIQIHAQTWSGLKRLTWNSGISSRPWVAAVSGSSIHVVWSDRTPGDAEIFYRRSTDGGTTWLALKRITWNSGDSSVPGLAVAANNDIHLVWYDKTPGNFELFHRKSTDGGNTWSALKRLTWSAGDSLFPAIATDYGNGVHIAWMDKKSGNEEIYYKRSADGGTTWSAIKRMTWNFGTSSNPSIAVDSANGIHLTWEDNTSGNAQIIHKKSTDSGASWTALKRITWNSAGAYEPSICTDSSNGVYVIWEDENPGNFEIFFKHSTDAGATWSALKRMTWNAGDSYGSAVAADSGTGVHIVWQDNSSGNMEIYYRESTDSGGTWSVVKRLSWNTGASSFPNITSDSSNGIHVGWADNTPGNTEIFYKNRK